MRPMQDSVSRATAFNSSLSQRAAAQAAMEQLHPASDVSPAQAPEAIRRAAYGDAAAPARMATAEPGPPAADAALGSDLQNGYHKPAAGSLPNSAGLAGDELLPAAARQVDHRAEITGPYQGAQFSVVSKCKWLCYASGSAFIVALLTTALDRCPILGDTDDALISISVMA